MNNILVEMQRIVVESRDEGLSELVIRTRLKEYLHYFALDFIYNSSFFKELVFYGGSCLRIVYGLARMSEDLDFETDRTLKPVDLKTALEKHFRGGLQIKTQLVLNEKRDMYRFHITLPVLYEIGLSSHRDAVLRIKLEIHPVPYLEKLASHCIFTPRSRYGRSFMVKHYDLPTLFSGKLLAILNRSTKGFHVGKKDEEVDYKGRDFYDLIWYMDQRILPNEEILRIHGVENSIGDIFDEIAMFISKRDVQKGITQDLEPLFERKEFVDNFTRTFRGTFSRLKQERYSAKRVKELIEITATQEFFTGKVSIVFTFSVEPYQLPITFVFELSDKFLRFAQGDIRVQPDKIYKDQITTLQVKKMVEARTEKYIALFLNKIKDYLHRHNNEVYFDTWTSKLIRMNDVNFNSQHEVVFSSGVDLASDHVKLEGLS